MVQFYLLMRVGRSSLIKAISIEIQYSCKQQKPTLASGIIRIVSITLIAFNFSVITKMKSLLKDGS